MLPTISDTLANSQVQTHLPNFCFQEGEVQLERQTGSKPSNACPSRRTPPPLHREETYSIRQSALSLKATVAMKVTASVSRDVGYNLRSTQEPFKTKKVHGYHRWDSPDMDAIVIKPNTYYKLEAEVDDSYSFHGKWELEISGPAFQRPVMGGEKNSHSDPILVVSSKQSFQCTRGYEDTLYLAGWDTSETHFRVDLCHTGCRGCSECQVAYLNLMYEARTGEVCQKVIAIYLE